MPVLIKKSLIIVELLLFLGACDVLAIDADRLGALKNQAYTLALSVLADSPVAPTKKELSALALPSGIWCAAAGTTLKSSIQEWQKTADWITQWQSEYDYPMLAKICFRGTFEQAMTGIIEAYKDAEYPLYLDIYPEQRLAVVSD